MGSRSQELYRWGHQMVFDGNRLGEVLVDFAVAWKGEVEDRDTKQPVSATAGEVKEFLELLARSSHPETMAKILGVAWGPAAAEKTLSLIADLEREIAALRVLVERTPIDLNSPRAAEAAAMVPSYRSPSEHFFAGVRWAEMAHNVRARKPL